MFCDAESRREVYNKSKLFFEEILVSHSGLLAICNTLFMNLSVEALNRVELYGTSSGVSHLIVRDDGKIIIKRVSDLSYIKESR